MKVCTRCKKEKRLEDFPRNRSCADGLSVYCRECKSDKAKESYARTPEGAKRRSAAQRKRNPKKIREYRQAYYMAHREKLIRAALDWVKKNRKRRRKTVRNWARVQAATNVKYRIRLALRQRIKDALKNTRKTSRTLEYVGCSLPELRQHLEKKFLPGMTWENYGRNGWHVDHIRPCCSFDLTDEDQQRQCFHYTNLRPLWEKDNLSKATQDRKESIHGLQTKNIPE